MTRLPFDTMSPSRLRPDRKLAAALRTHGAADLAAALDQVKAAGEAETVRIAR